MIGPASGTRVVMATRPVDFRKGPDALAALVSADYGGDPYSGVIYVFSGLVTVWFRSLVSHYAILASKAKGLMPPRYEWRLRAL